jgi:hypothetical protein
VKQLKKEGPTPSIEAGAIFEQYLGAGSSGHQTTNQSQRGFRSFSGACRTVAGHEAVSMSRNGQAKWVGAYEVEQQTPPCCGRVQASPDDGMLQVHTQVPNNELREAFREWHPGINPEQLVEHRAA